jgi:hypothetical protein
MTTMLMLESAEVDIAYDVHGPLPAADGRPPLFMIGQPMDASGFGMLASHFPDRTVVTYDPRGQRGRVDPPVAVHGQHRHPRLVQALQGAAGLQDSRMLGGLDDHVRAGAAGGQRGAAHGELVGL